MSSNLAPDERETCLSMTGDDHSTWVVFTDDPFWIRRLDKIATAYQELGEGRMYRLDAGQVSIRRKRQVSAAERARLRNMLLVS